ncbi:MAG: methyltransferase type 11, partial [Chitinophagaceae bacterium]
AEKNGKTAQLQSELEELFVRENRSSNPNHMSIPATFLKVTVTK